MRNVVIGAVVVLTAALALGVWHVANYLRVGVGINGDTTELMRRLNTGEMQVDGFELETFERGESTRRTLSDRTVLVLFQKLEKIDIFNGVPAGRAVTGKIVIGSCRIPCAVVVGGRRVSLHVSDGILTDGKYYRVPPDSPLADWMLAQITE